MDNQIISVLKQRLDEARASGPADVEALRNVLKEELQYYVLDFVYNHPEYKSWVMYGGSALRICHNLNRMSVDLDFEIAERVTEEFLEELRAEIARHFERTYHLGAGVLMVKVNHGRGLVLKFLIGEALGLGHASDQVHVKLDLNTFMPPKTVVTERHPINRSQLSFVIISYNMSALMASKIAAIFLRGERGVGADIFQEKGRDIYDLLWYMEKKIVPDFDYLNAKHVEQAKDIRTLFTKLTIKMNEVSNDNLKQDLSPLFLDQRYITNWLTNWRESYLRLVEEYRIRTITELTHIDVFQEFIRDIFWFTFEYATAEGDRARIIYAVSDYWMEFKDQEISTVADAALDPLIERRSNGATSHPTPDAILKKYATLFRDKNEAYFRKTGRVIVGDTIKTKLIRVTTDNLNQREEIFLDKSALLSCELDDLLK